MIVNAMNSHYLHKRLLKINVGFLLSEALGSAREIPISIPQRVKIDSELDIEALEGRLLLTHTKEGILAQGIIQVKHKRECDRCLDALVHTFDVQVAELFASPPDASKSVFSVSGSGNIDLAPLLREEVLIEAGYRVVCHDSCRGLSAASGLNLNRASETAADAPQPDAQTTLDPRLAVLKQLLDKDD